MQAGPAVSLAVVVLGLGLLFLAFRRDEARSASEQGAWHRLEAWWLRRRGWHRKRRHSVALAVIAGVLIVAVGWVAFPGDPRGDPWDLGEPDGSGHFAVPALVATADPSAEQTAAALSAELLPDGASDVLLVHHLPTADALAAAGLQQLLDAPLLLTDETGLSPEAAAEIERLGSVSVHILGGEGVVSAAVEEQLAAAGQEVHRRAGPSAAETAIDIAQEHFPDARAAVLAPTFSATDGIDRVASALVAGGLAAARELPALLTGSSALSPSTGRYLQEAAIQELVVVGGEAEIGAAVLAEVAALGIAVERVGGEDRFATAAAIASVEAFASGAGGDQVVLLVEGSGEALWPAVSIAAAVAGRNLAPTLLSDGSELPAATRTSLAERRGLGARVLCMPGVEGPACEEAVRVLAEQR